MAKDLIFEQNHQQLPMVLLRCYDGLRNSHGLFRSHCIRIISNTLARNYASISPSRFAELAADPNIKYHIYISRSTDPYFNLSIEHFLLKKTPVGSTVLLLYTNRPCVVIGRNQNPWLEVNLQLLNAIEPRRAHETRLPTLGDVLLVRRRSGGGTVFHDEGNVNYCVICPKSNFYRDKHAEMVVRALRRLGIDRARVNDRHDIVLDRGSRQTDDDGTNTHTTAYMTDDAKGARPSKISGSAFKLTGFRSLHHGTCLLSSPNLEVIPHYLHSPAKSYIKALGVDSVSSPVGNVGISKSEFERSVVDKFAAMYGLKSGLYGATTIPSGFQIGEDLVAGVIDGVASEISEISEGISELCSRDWKYMQTPQFTFSSHPNENDSRARPDLPAGVPASARVFLKARAATIMDARISLSADTTIANKEAENTRRLLVNRKLHEIEDWTEIVKLSKLCGDAQGTLDLSRWLNSMLRTSF